MYEQVPHVQMHSLDGSSPFWTGRLPADLVFSEAERDALWQMHPADYHLITIHGRSVRTPRWQQAYGADYHYTGQVNRALPVPSLLSHLCDWVREAIEPRISGILVNWYDGNLRHYIGPHRDSTKFLCRGAPIVTVSFGSARTFRLRRWKGQERHDFAAENGSLFILPCDTNLTWTHEVPHRGGVRGRRISVTFRAFNRGISPEKS